jgi:ribonuclease D
MDPHAERWPHVNIVRDELRILRTEMTVSEQKARNAHYLHLKKAMQEPNYYLKELQRLQRNRDKNETRKSKSIQRILRRRTVSNLTQVMLEKGAQIYERLQDGGTITD